MLSLAEALGALPDTADGIAAHLTTQGIRGVPSDACNCPIANYLTGLGFTDVNVGDIWIAACGDDSGSEVIDTPEPVGSFVNRLDDGEWPELVLDDAAEVTPC